jgi:GWxTD domain-containing protein
MWLVPLLLVFALPVRGELKLTLEQSAYPADDSGTVLEVSYEIPNTSLTFLREDSGFVARYQISIQASDRRRDILAGDLWQKVVRLREYGPTMARDSVEAGTVSLVVPTAALDARVEVNDQGSERSALALFRIERPTGGLTIRLYRSGKPVSMRKYGIGDTLVAVVETASGPGTGDSPHPGTASFDSCRFMLKRDRRVVTGATIQTTMRDEGGGMKPQARFEYPIGDSAGVARLGGGEYSLEVVGLASAAPVGQRGGDRALRASVGFRIEVPFFLDDSEYLHRVEQLVYVASGGELKHLRSVPRGERQQAWREFWKKEHALTRGRYVSEEEYFERIDYAQEHFAHGERGYLSDRGHVYVLYGAPDQVESRPFDIDSPAYEIWYYYQTNKEFGFVDRFGAGGYVLQNREEL